MPVGEFFNNLKENLIHGSTSVSLTSHPIFISILIVSILLLLVALIIDDNNFIYSLFKIGVYSIISIILLMLLHDNSIRIKNETISSDIKATCGEVPEDDIIGNIKPLSKNNFKTDEVGREARMGHNMNYMGNGERNDDEERYYGAKVDDAERLLLSLNKGLDIIPDNHKAGWNLPRY